MGGRRDPDYVDAILAVGGGVAVAAAFLVVALVLAGCVTAGPAPDAAGFWRAWGGMTPAEREAVCRNRPAGVDELYGARFRAEVDRFAEACEPYE